MYGGPNRPSAYGIADPAHVERARTQWLIDIWLFYRDIGLAVTARRVGLGARDPHTISSEPDRPDSVPTE